MPSAISVNMFGLRFTSEAQARWKNGAPPQSTTGVARTSCTRRERATASGVLDRLPGIISDIASTKTGSVERQRTPEPPRHVEQLGARSFVRGGHALGLERHAAQRAGARAGSRTSGCIGHV